MLDRCEGFSMRACDRNPSEFIVPAPRGASGKMYVDLLASFSIHFFGSNCLALLAPRAPPPSPFIPPLPPSPPSAPRPCTDAPIFGIITGTNGHDGSYTCGSILSAAVHKTRRWSRAALCGERWLGRHSVKTLRTEWIIGEDREDDTEEQPKTAMDSFENMPQLPDNHHYRAPFPGINPTFTPPAGFADDLPAVDLCAATCGAAGVGRCAQDELKLTGQTNSTSAVSFRELCVQSADGLPWNGIGIGGWAGWLPPEAFVSVSAADQELCSTAVAAPPPHTRCANSSLYEGVNATRTEESMKLWEAAGCDGRRDWRYCCQINHTIPVGSFYVFDVWATSCRTWSACSRARAAMGATLLGSATLPVDAPGGTHTLALLPEWPVRGSTAPLSPITKAMADLLPREFGGPAPDGAPPPTLTIALPPLSPPQPPLADEAEVPATARLLAEGTALARRARFGAVLLSSLALAFLARVGLRARRSSHRHASSMSIALV